MHALRGLVVGVDCLWCRFVLAFVLACLGWFDSIVTCCIVKCLFTCILGLGLICGVGCLCFLDVVTLLFVVLVVGIVILVFGDWLR